MAELGLKAIQAAPASDALLYQLADLIGERRDHVHPEPGQGPDLHCMNLVAYMGEHMEAVLARLAAAEARVDDLTGQVAGRDALTAKVEAYAERIWRSNNSAYRKAGRDLLEMIVAARDLGYPADDGSQTDG